MDIISNPPEASLPSTHSSLHLSNEFTISCGTVTIDLKTSKVLLILYRKTGEFLLPKGRKNFGEKLEETAIRETYEETGYKVELLPLPIVTLATGRELARLDTFPSNFNIEPIAVQQRISNGKLKIIFWFAAKGDSASVPKNGTQQEGEDFDARWVPKDEGLKILTFNSDCQIFAKVLDAVQEGQKMWKELETTGTYTRPPPRALS
ncbi:MAG: hypothetical protein MMC33_001973 [Icmadophila ericetorum]|nr:hypothetical protein [Icmadophila ericetorum]